MFAPVGYTDIRRIMRSLTHGLNDEYELFFPSLQHVDVEHLAWLAWAYGEFDFIEKAVFSTAFNEGLFLCSRDGQVLKISVNPATIASASAIEMYEDDESYLSLKERLITGVPARKGMDYEVGTDPWAKHRDGGYRSVPMVYSRSDYTVTLSNHDDYLERLRDAGYRTLAKYPFLFGSVVEDWRGFEGWSICISDSCLDEFSCEKMQPKIQYEVLAAIWDNPEEMFSELLEQPGGRRNATGMIALETRALHEAEKLLADASYKFLTLDGLRQDIDLELGERAWRRVIDRLRPKFPFISRPGRKS